MSATVTDLFCGAGGSSVGAAAAGATIVMAANHWQTAIDVHQANHPDAGHDCADISQADPRRYPRTNILIASPECTNHSQARGVSRKKQDTTLFDAPDASAERSRATMWDVVRFTEQMDYEAVIVENVIEAVKWTLWPAWRKAMEDLGYDLTLLSHNSMHHGVPQSRDRIYCVWLKRGIVADLELQLTAPCQWCEKRTSCRQAWKESRSVGRHGQQYVWACLECGRAVQPDTEPAAKIIDWTLPTPRFDCKHRAQATRDRIAAGLQRYGWAPIITTGAGNTHERTPGNRARSLDMPVPTMQATATAALATPPGFLVDTAHQGARQPRSIDAPYPTVAASDDRLSLIVPMRNHGQATETSEPVNTVSAGGNHHALIVTNRSTSDGNHGRRTNSVNDPLTTVTAGAQHHALITSYNKGVLPTPVEQPITTIATHDHHGLLMRNNLGGAEMVTPLSEPARTMTTAGHQSLLVPSIDMLDLDALVDACGFRMLEPFEVARAMAFEDDYIPTNLPKKDQVRLAGNAVTPPVMTWIMGRVLNALENR